MQPGVPKLVYQLPQVSILYEANEVCNLLIWGVLQAGSEVSILYEANEVCNKYPMATWSRAARFNPLRG